MEDAHIAEVGLSGDATCAIFGVFDGHGGAEVAKFCQKYMADEIQKLREFDGGTVEDALVAVFHRMDEMLRDHMYAEELEQLKTKEADEDEDLDKEGGAGGMDAFEVIKRMFQMKRFIPENGAAEGGEGSGGAAGAGGEEAAAEAEPMDTAEEAAPLPLEPADMRVQAGCTAVVAVKKGAELFVANAGDSRGVLCRGGQAVALSVDHKPAQESERNRIINAGGQHQQQQQQQGRGGGGGGHRLGGAGGAWASSCQQRASV
jgi:protein phosphatase 1G